MTPTEPQETIEELKATVAELKKEIQDLKDIFPEFQRYKQTRIAQVSEITIDELWERKELSRRAINCLWSAEMKTVGDVARISDENLFKYRNIGKKTLKEIRDCLAKLGIPRPPSTIRY